MSRPRYIAADRRPTWTSRVVDHLRAADDLVPLPALRAAIGASNDQLCAAVYHLRVRAGALDAVEQDGVLYVMLTGEDRRSRTVEERVPEPKGNRSRRPARQA